VLNEGFQSAFAACVVLAGTGAALALLLLCRPHQATGKQAASTPMPVSSDPATTTKASPT